jgi:preprotein translocase subunit SecA
MDESMPIENKLVNRSIEGAQVRVEGFHFDMRKHLVEYDDVVNKHRELIYAERRKILDGTDLKTNILSMVRDEIRNMVASHIADEHGVDWDVKGLLADLATILLLPPALTADSLLELRPKQIEEKLTGLAETLYEEREKELGPENMRALERLVMLRIIDNLWVEHLTAMENMRMQAGWQTLRQTRAVDAYKREGYRQFQTLLDTIQHDVAHTIYHVNIARKEPSAQAPSLMAQVAGRGHPVGKQKTKVGGRKIGRNEPCPCGSGKKYKHCCGR